MSQTLSGLEQRNNFIEIKVTDPQLKTESSGLTSSLTGPKKYTDFEVQVKTNNPIFKLKESSVRRRYSDFEWLKKELEKRSKMIVPELPDKAFARNLPSFIRKDNGLFENEFVEDRRKSLEEFLNKVVQHPLAQNERCLHMFLQEETLDKQYTPGKV